MALEDDVAGRAGCYRTLAVLDDLFARRFVALHCGQVAVHNGLCDNWPDVVPVHF